MDKTILIFSQEAGTATVLKFVIDKLLTKGLPLEIYALPPSLYMLKRYFNDVKKYEKFPDKGYGLLLTGYGHPRLEVNSEIIKYARKKGLKSIAILDNWKGIERFNGVNGKLTENLPDILAVMDQITKKILCEMGMIAENIIVTGHPFLESCGLGKTSVKDKEEARKKLNIPQKTKVCLLASELVHFHSYYEVCNTKCCSLFDMHSSRWPLKYEIMEREGSNATFFMRLHPSENKAYSNGIRNISFEEADEDTILTIADTVYGLSSIFIQMSVLHDVHTYNVAPMLNNWRPENSFLIPELWNYLAGHGYLGNYNDIGATKPDHSGALNNIMELIIDNL